MHTLLTYKTQYNRYVNTASAAQAKMHLLTGPCGVITAFVRLVLNGWIQVVVGYRNK